MLIYINKHITLHEIACLHTNDYLNLFDDLQLYFMCNYIHENNTPIHIAVLFNNFHFLSHIYNKLQDVQLFEIKNSYNHTPLHLAVLLNNSDMVSFLLNIGITRTKLDIYNKTPLDYAMYLKYNHLVNLLCLF
jgi:ankyrin repeat protein